MSKKITMMAAPMLAALLCASTAQRAAGAETNLMAKEFETSTTREIRVKYLLHLPAQYEVDKEKKWPVILFLHGAGERGSDVWKVATHGPPKIAAKDKDFPFIVISPQCPEGQIWQVEPLVALLDDVMKMHRVDPARVYLTGLSMGGYGTWTLGLTHPDKFAAIVPICGGGDLITTLVAGREKAAALKSLGIWAFHGGKDPVVPVSESERMVERVKKAGVTDVKLTIYPEAQHDSWTEAYKNPELYKWMLAHERSGGK